jgi:hypothetical protein
MSHPKEIVVTAAKAYVGAKIIMAVPQDRDGKPGYRVGYPDGYESWSPKETFESAYREVTDAEKEMLAP